MAYKLEILPFGEKDEAKRERQIVKNPKGCIVLVHGICHGAWCWENFIDYFADRGYQCYAVSLRGHGKSDGCDQLQTFRLSDYVEDVKTVVELCAKESQMKPFLLGHSMGGAVVQQYIGEYAGTVEGAVLFAPATAPCMSSEDSHRIKPSNLLWAALIAQYGLKRGFFVHNAAFFTGQNEQGKKCQRVKDTSPYQSLLQKESVLITGDLKNDGDLNREYSKNREVDIPILVIGSHADLYFPKESLEQTAGEYAKNGKTGLVILDRLCHDMMLDDYEPKAWEASAVPVLEFVEDPLGFVDNPENHWPRK